MDCISERIDLDLIVASGRMVVIDIRDGGSPASEAFSAAVGSVAERFPEVLFARLDVAVAPDVAALFGIREAPSLLMFRAGVGLFAGEARFSEAQLEAIVLRALRLDMDQVRREMDRGREGMQGAASFRACPASKRGDFPAP